MSEIEGIDYVVCRICNVRKKALSYHIHIVHDIDADIYRMRYPGSKVVCDSTRKKKSRSGQGNPYSHN